MNKKTTVCVWMVLLGINMTDPTYQNQLREGLYPQVGG